MSSQLDRLFSQLNTTGLQNNNIRLYQLLQQLITFLRQIESELATAATASVADVATKTFLTSTNETASLPNSRELIAGTDITFDDSVPGQKTLNVSASATPGGVDGDIQFNDAGSFGGSVLKQPSPDVIEQVDGTNTQESRFYNTLSGGDYERLTLKILNDLFGSAAFTWVMEKAGAGVTKGIQLESAGSISLNIPGNFPNLLLYPDPTSNGGINLVPKGASFIGTIFCEQSGSIMWTPGGYGIPHMIDMITATVNALIIGDTVSGADFVNRYLAFDTLNKRLSVGNTGNGTNICLIPDAAINKQIANLPASPAKGSILWVNDALAPTIGSAVAAGGTAFALLCWNGSQWTVIGI